MQKKASRRQALKCLIASTVAANYMFSCKTASNSTKALPTTTDTAIAPQTTSHGMRIHSLEGPQGHGISLRSGRMQSKFMNIVSTAPLTITDTAWHSFLQADHYKRWKIDDGDWQESPLINQKLSPAYQSKAVSIEVAIFSNKDYIFPVKIYQQLLFFS
jgi:hypothetical protein